jgi:hypothetical protein
MTLHNKELEKQRDEVLNALDLTIEDLLVQRDDHAKYASGEDRDEILEEIDNHLDKVATAKDTVIEWAIKLDNAISSKVF